MQTLAIVMGFVALLFAGYSAGVSDRCFRELKKDESDLQLRLDAAEARLKTLIERLEEDGK